MKQEFLIDALTLRRKLIRLFARHIGKNNSVRINDILYYIFGDVIMEDMNIYERVFYWEATKKVLRELRRNGTLFTVRYGNSYYVLSNQAELLEFERVTNKHIGNLKRLMGTARQWVDEKKYILAKQEGYNGKNK